MRNRNVLTVTSGLSDRMDILRILDELHELAVMRPKSFGPIVWGLDRDEINTQICKVRASLPSEMKQAVQTVRESERIVDTAREDAYTTVESARKESERIVAEANLEAQRILDQAKIQQDRMLSENEILKISKAQSEEIRNSAERDSNQIRRGADKYAFDVLTHLETVLGKTMAVVDRGKAEVQPAQAVVPTPRDKVRV
jgi:cell division septum initiation protein DivIVA